MSSPSIVSSIGYYTGYVPRWLGAKLLSFIVAIDSRRRIWKAGRLIQRTEKVPGATLEVWLVKNQKSVNELIDDLLELSSYVELIPDRSRPHVNHCPQRQLYSRNSKGIYNPRVSFASVADTGRVSSSSST